MVDSCAHLIHDFKRENLEKERKADMNTKLNLASIVVTIFLIATACAPDDSSLPILDLAQPEEAGYEMVPLVPITGEQSYETGQQAYDFEQEARAYPSQQLHSACVSADIHRQGRCEESEQNGANFLSGKENTEAPTYPSQKLHSHCVSEDVQRQYSCMD
jgi:hypothetical protein